MLISRKHQVDTKANTNKDHDSHHQSHGVHIHVKQNTIVVCGVHGRRQITKMDLSGEVTNFWWDKLYDLLVLYNANFSAGDFRMPLTDVVPQLKKRGL